MRVESQPNQSISLEQSPSKETQPTPRIYLAYLFRPETTDCPHAEQIGIPHQPKQLLDINITIGSRRVPLIELLVRYDLVRPADAIPHLSVGGTVNPNRAVQKLLSVTVDSNLARSYICDGIGVQGMGLISLSENEQSGFGVQGAVQRVASGEDMGGGMSFERAVEYAAISQVLRVHMYLSIGEVPVARIFKVLPLHFSEVPHPYTGHPQLSAVVVREDGVRGVPKKKLFQAIQQVLPVLTDNGFVANDFFEADGHNAFFRDGQVCFTDFETVRMSQDIGVSYIVELGQQWYMHEFRRQFSAFCRSYNLVQTGTLADAQYDHMKSSLQALIEVTDAEDSIEKIHQAIESHATRNLTSFALAGVIASRREAIAHLRAVLNRELQSSAAFVFSRVVTPQQLYAAVAFEVGVREIEVHTPLGKRIAVFVRNGVLQAELEIETFGLPIEPSVQHTITLADIFRAAPAEYRTGRIVLPDEFASDFFDAENAQFLQHTFYSFLRSAVADHLHAWKLPERTSGTDRFQLYTEVSDEQLTLVAPIGFSKELPNIIFETAAPLQIAYEAEHRQCRISSTPDLLEYDLEALNKLLYTLHIAIAELAEDPRNRIVESDGAVHIVVTGV